MKEHEKLACTAILQMIEQIFLYAVVKQIMPSVVKAVCVHLYLFSNEVFGENLAEPRFGAGYFFLSLYAHVVYRYTKFKYFA